MPDERLAMLRALGFGALEHDSHVPFLSHLVGTRRVLESWGCVPALCDAGLFHSVYGTEYFDSTTEITRDEVREVIGDAAERLAWLWCTIERDTISPTGTVIDRHTGERLHLEPAVVGDLVTLWCADTVEQIGRMEPAERDFARGLPDVLALASPAAAGAVADIVDVIREGPSST